MAAPLLWNPKLGDLPKLRALAKRTYTDEEVDWWSARVKYYLHEKKADMTKAMERATADLKKKQDESSNPKTPPPASQRTKA